MGLAALLMLLPLLPLAQAAATALPTLRCAVVWTLPVVPAMGVAVYWLADEHWALALPWWLAGGRLALDDVGLTILWVTSVVWLSSALLVAARASRWRRSPRFLAFYLLAMGGNFGAVVAGDAVTFYTAFSIMSLCIAALVLETRSADARQAAVVYVCLAIIGEVLILTTLMVVGASSDKLIFPLPPASLGPMVVIPALLGFGVKTGLFPLHVSLPLIYRTTPLPAAVALAGAMINAGLLGWIRFLPFGTETGVPLAGTLLVLGAVTSLYCIAVGWMQRTPQAVLAYSSASKMGLMLMGLGIGLASPEQYSLAVAAVAVYALHHGFAKAALFYALAWRTGTVRRTSAGFWVLTAAGAGSFMGVPFTSGALAEAALTEAAGLAGAAAWVKPAILAIAAGTVILMWHYLVLAGNVEENAGEEPAQDGVFADVGGLLLFLGVLGGSWMAAGQFQEAAVTWHTALVVTATLTISSIGFFGARRLLGDRTVLLPSGDILVLWMRGGKMILAVWHHAVMWLAPAVQRWQETAYVRNVWRKALVGARRRERLMSHSLNAGLLLVLVMFLALAAIGLAAVLG